MEDQLTMDEAIIQQQDISEWISRAWTNTKKLGKDKMTTQALSIRLTKLNDNWDQYVQNHHFIKRFDDSKKTQYVKEAWFDKTEEIYYDIHSCFNEYLDSLKPLASVSGQHEPGAQQGAVAAQFHLPKFTIPDFDGDVLAWESFRDQFKGILDKSPTLSNVQKILLLQQHLQGDAKEMLKNTPVVEGSFDGAWKALESRYGNKRILISHHMNSLLSLTPMSNSSSNEIKRVLDFFAQTVRSFEALGIVKDNWNHWLVLLLSQKLNAEIRVKWETSLTDTTEFPNIDALNTFLENYARALESIDEGVMQGGSSSKDADKLKKEKSQTKKQINAATSQSSKKGKVKSYFCPLCNNNDHALTFCSKFKALQGTDRYFQAKKLRLCYNCLKNHYPTPCPSKFTCKVCSEKHNTLLHGCFPVKESIAPATVSSVNQIQCTTASSSNSVPTCQCSLHNNTTSNNTSNSTELRTSNVNATSSSNTVVLLATAKVSVCSAAGNSLTLRALIDSGSDTSIISEWAAQSLRLRRHSTNTLITGVLCKSGSANQEVSFTVTPRNNNSFCLHVSALVLKRVTNPIPSQTSSLRQWPHIENLELADPEFYLSSPIDLILGGDVCDIFFTGDSISGPPGTPTAFGSPFGYVLLGPTSVKQKPILKTSCNVSSTKLSTQNIMFDLKKFWELENVGNIPFLSPEEIECEKHFKETHSRKSSGKYVVKLPFSSDESITLGPTRHFAVKVLESSERKMSKNEVYAKKYVESVHDFSSLGHMVKIPRNKLNMEANYISHHGVFKVNDPSGKFRWVFNASHNTSTGHSLNSKLLTGPKLQLDLWVILTRWRFFKIVFTADMVKMFRQIEVHPDDWDWQRVVWRDSPNEEITDYWITVVMFGQACAPYLALRCKQQLVEDEGRNFPLASVSLNERTYVDDIFEGADDEETAQKIKNELINLLHLGGFPLAKWASNCPILAEKSNDKFIKESDSVTTLGVVWSPHLDSFNIRGSLEPGKIDYLNKRILLSEISKLFDPLGWFAPVIINAKILIQDLWLLNLEWDSELPTSVVEKWVEFRSSLPCLNEITIPRWVSTFENSEIEFHCFSDASERAYAAVIYVVAKNGENKTSSLLVSKTRVAPIKRLSIPRLELCAAELLVLLANKLIPSLNLKNEKIKVFGWSDSSVVLTWIKSHPSKWKPFVAHRVASIQNSLVQIDWRYVPTKCNPADVATRGIAASEFEAFSLWWQGPTWLVQSNESWPAREFQSNESKINVEVKSISNINTTVTVKVFDLLEKFSNVNTLIKVVAYCLRALKAKDLPKTINLSNIELDVALCTITKISQQSSFPREYEALKNNKKIPKTSSLLSLKPFLDSGCIRVGGRVRHSFLSYNEKHPFIIAKNTVFAKSLVQQAHLRCLHGGQELTRNVLLQRFWILRGRSYIRSVLRKCVICTKYHARTTEQVMGQLPSVRLKPEKPFLKSGVDYAGPFWLRASSGRGIKSMKGYICLFVCLVTKAVHLEVVTSLSTQSFIAAFKRFISRRGSCSEMYSDNATNFKGAAAELASMFSKASTFYKEVSHSLVSEGTTWSFIPPSSPHFGGLWEAGVKSVKSHLKKIIGEQKLTYEDMSTFLCQVEACLNSRPLYPASNDPTDLLPLTPAHFLIGGPINAYPEVPSDLQSKSSLTNKFKLITNMRDHFWNRWSKEYIHHLQQSYRWHNPVKNIEVGNLVLLKDDLLPATKWPIARVTEVFKGPDNLVRVVNVKTATGVYKRPIVKLVPLPVDTNSDNC